MCTVTIIPKARDSRSPAGVIGFRLVCNRDEQRDRADATPPRWREIDGAAGRAIWPADGEAGGTWVATDQFGLTLCLLNRNPIPPTNLPVSGLVSRGKIIPMLLTAGSGAQVARRASGLDLDAFAPFRLVSVDPRARPSEFIHEMVWDRREFIVRTHGVRPICFASSGLGDERVLARLDLFASMVVGAGATPEAQDLFHGHRWAERPEVSVMMSRAEARTVSMTHVEVDSGAAGTASISPGGVSVRMRYRPVVADVDRKVEVASSRSSMASGSGPR